MAIELDVQAQIRAHILENCLYTTDDTKLLNTDSLLEQGIVDSTGILELVLFVEEAFGFTVEDEEVVPDNFDSVERLKRYVQDKMEGTASRAGP
jgi:acyl carrier protein